MATMSNARVVSSAAVVTDVTGATQNVVTVWDLVNDVTHVHVQVPITTEVVVATFVGDQAFWDGVYDQLTDLVGELYAGYTVAGSNPVTV